jgi:hypothetical protein
MGNRRCVCWLTVLLGCASAQGAPFVNLNFEQATVPPGSMNFLPAAQAFPGWTPAIGGVPLNVVHYNNPGIGEGAVVLYDQPLFIGGFHVIEGTYSVALLTDHGFNLVASLSQTGDVPVGTRSLRLLASISIRPPRVFVDNVELPLLRLSDPIGPPGGAHFIWGADATVLSGRTDAILRLSSNSLGQPDSTVGLDAISWSPLPVPEPVHGSTFMLLTTIAAARRRSN